jgi:hypothetical protein
MSSVPSFIPERRWVVESTVFRIQCAERVIVPRENRKKSVDPLLVKVIQVDRVDGKTQTITMRGIDMLPNGTTSHTWREEVYYVSAPDSPSRMRLPGWAVPLLGAG